jgi:uncharacterized membrane protein (DUF485 family)
VSVQVGEERAAGYRAETDWRAIEESPEFRELTSRKKAFVVPATIFFMVWYFGFIALCGYASDFMGREFLTDGLTVGYVLALTQFVMSWALAAMYVRRANRVFDPLAERARQAAAPVESAGTGRFRRGVFYDGAAGDEAAARDAATSEEVSRR